MLELKKGVSDRPGNSSSPTFHLEFRGKPFCEVQDTVLDLSHNLYKRKGLEGTQRITLGNRRKVQVKVQGKACIHPYQEGQCHRRIVHASKKGAVMESVRKDLDYPVLTQ